MRKRPEPSLPPDSPKQLDVTPQFVAQMAQEKFDVKLSAEIVNHLVGMFRMALKRNPFRTSEGGYNWMYAGSENSFSSWLKLRLMELGIFRPGHNLFSKEVRLQPCELHLGFLSLPETEEMLIRLRLEAMSTEEAAVARSKLGKVLGVQNVQPIDAVAARVAPPPRGSAE